MGSRTLAHLAAHGAPHLPWPDRSRTFMTRSWRKEPRAVHGTMVLCVKNALNRGGLARAVAL